MTNEGRCREKQCEGRSREKRYILPGSPVPLARVRFGNGRVWDSQKDLKLVNGIHISNQHDDEPFFVGPILLDVTFYMPIPQRRAKNRTFIHHYIKPDLDNLIKFSMDICNLITYRDDCIVSVINARKLYDENPRTIIILRELNE